MKSLLEETKWLLAFANLGKTPGKLAPPFLKSEKLKRKPEVAEPSMLYPSLNFFSNPSLVDDGMYAMRPKMGLTKGYFKEFPFEEFENLISKQGIPPLTPPLTDASKIIFVKRDACQSSWYWILVNCVLESIINEERLNLDDILSELLNDPSIKPIQILKKDKILFYHDCLFPQAIIAFLMNFKINQTELHSRLKQCPACGSFRLQEKGKRIFCNIKCEDAFNARSKVEDVHRMKKFRRSVQFKKMLQRLQKKPYDYSEKAAKQLARTYIEKGLTLKDL